MATEANVFPKSDIIAASPRRFVFNGWSIVAWIVLIITTIVALFPMYWLFANAFTPITSNPPPHAHHHSRVQAGQFRTAPRQQ